MHLSLSLYIYIYTYIIIACTRNKHSDDNGSCDNNSGVQGCGV